MGMLAAPGGGARGYADLRAEAPEAARGLLDAAREACLALGGDVVEDVRMHRVVFAKSVSFRWFADVHPGPGGLTIRLQMGRKEPARVLEVADLGQLSGAAGMMRDAYERVR